MALVLNAGDISTQVRENSTENNHQNTEGSNYHLIIIKGDDLIEEGHCHADINSKNDFTSFRMNFQVIDYILRVNVQSHSNVLNVSTLILYHIDSQRNFQFMESLDVSNLNSNSTFSFGRKFQFFSQTNELDAEKLVDKHLCFYCQTIVKEIRPIKLQIMNREMPVDFFTLYEEKFLTDYRIVCKGREFLVHKLVLAARSSVFRATIESQMQDGEDGEMKIKNFDPEIVGEMLHYIYTDEIRMGLTLQQLEKIVMIADYFLLEKLKLLCMKEVSKNVRTVSEVLEVFTIAKAYNVKDFKEAVIQFLKDNRHIL